MQVSIKNLDLEKDSKEAERMQQKNQAPMSREEQEVIREILKRKQSAPFQPREVTPCQATTAHVPGDRGGLLLYFLYLGLHNISPIQNCSTHNAKYGIPRQFLKLVVS